jgi:hypothetical protein
MHYHKEHIDTQLITCIEIFEIRKKMIACHSLSLYILNIFSRELVD